MPSPRAGNIRAAIPQVIIASAFDQFFNGHRIQDLGLGTWCKKNTADTSIIKNKLQVALELPIERIQDFQGRLKSNNETENSCQLLNEIATSAHSRN